MKIKDIKQITNEVVEERVTLGDIGRAGDGARIGSNIAGRTGAKVGAKIGYYSRDVVTAGVVGYALKKLYDAYKKEKDPKKKTALKAKINKAKTKIKAKKTVKESYVFTENDLVEIFGGKIANHLLEFGGKVGGYLDRRKEAKRIKDLKQKRGVERAERKSRLNTADEKLGDRVMDTRIAKNVQNTWDSNKDVQTGTKVAAAGVAGVLAYKLYKKLKSKYDSATDPKEKAKLKKLVVKAKAKTKKK